MSDFEKHWKNFGELQASMCGGDIKKFAKEIWDSAKIGTLTASDWEELEQTTNREKQVYAQSDIDKLNEEISRLRAELDRKDEALREIARMVNDFGTTSGMIVGGTIYEAVGIANKALQNKEAR